MIIAIFAAYGVSRWRFRGRSVFTTAVLSTQMFPGILFLLPLYIIFVNIHTDDRHPAGRHAVGPDHHLPDLHAAVRDLDAHGYFDNIPRDLDEAAKVDGASALARCSG